MNLEARKPGRLGHTALTDRILGAAVQVHRGLGPGFLESVYEEALALEFTDLAIPFERQKTVPILYRGHPVGEHRLDFLVDSKIIVELKAVRALENIHFAVVRSYLTATELSDALLLNFASTTLTIKRVGPVYSPAAPDGEIGF